jgi:4-amino-4-deoxy-L-arabinose transferase-like glycosyltransferase
MKSMLLMLAVLAVLRVSFLLATLDPAEERVMEVLDPSELEWDAGPERPLYDREELFTATAAEAIRGRFGLPLTSYQFMAYGGGSLVVALLAAPVHTIFGPSYLAFKLIPFLVTLLGALFWTQLATWIWGRRAGWTFAALYLLAPSVFVRTMWIAKGDHSEAATWIGGALLLAACAATWRHGLDRSIPDTQPQTRSTNRDDGEIARRGRYAFACGLAVGFGIFLTYSTVPVTVAILGSALLVTRARPRRVWLFGAAGLALGCVPWIWNLARTRGDALRVYSRPLGASENAAEAWTRARLLIEDGFLASYDLPGGAGEAAAAIFALAFLAGSLAVAIHAITSWRASRSPANSDISSRSLVDSDIPSNSPVNSDITPRSPSGSFTASTAMLGGMVLVGVLAHLLAFCLSAPDRSSRYLMPVYPLLLLVIAGAASGALPRLHHLRRIAGALALLTLLCGLGAQALAISNGRYRPLAAPLRSTDWPLLGEVVGQKLSWEQIASVPELVAPYLWNGLGMRLYHAAEMEDWAEAIALLPENARAHVWEGIGIVWGQSNALEAGARLDSLPREAQRDVARGIVRYAELPVVPLSRGGFDGAETSAKMVGRYTDLLDPARARIIALLERHGYPTPRSATAGLSPQWIEYGVGAAAYGGIGYPGPSLWFWSEARDDPRNGSAATWRGVTDSFHRDLRTLPPRWLLAEGDAPTEFAKLLEACTAACSVAQKTAFYEAAGSAAKAAWNDPDVNDALRARRGEWPWRAAIPPEMHSAFAAGLDRQSQ